MSQNIIIALISLVSSVLGAAISAFAIVVAAERKGQSGGQGTPSCSMIGFVASIGAATGLVVGAIIGIILFQNIVTKTNIQEPQISYQPTQGIVQQIQPTNNDQINNTIPQSSVAPQGVSTPVRNNSGSSDNLIPCPSLKSGETRQVTSGAYIVGDVIIDGVTQYDPGGTSEGTVAFFEKEASVTSPWGAGCYSGNKDLVQQLIQRELKYGCGSRCANIRFVLVQSDGQQPVQYFNK